MELSLRLDTLGMVEMRYLRGRDRYRDWPGFLLHAASRQARVMAYLTRDVAEQLHQQILVVESTVGIDEDDDEIDIDEIGHREETRSAERDSAPFSPALASALDQLNKLARQRLPEVSSGASSELPVSSGELPAETELAEGEEEDALEQLQDAFVQMMEVVRELAEELSTDALKLTGRFRCARTNIEFIQAEIEDDDDDDDESDDNDTIHIRDAEDGVEVEMELELVMVLQLFEEGRSRPDDLPAVELQLDVDDFERLHETLDLALESERKSRRRK